MMYLWMAGVLQNIDVAKSWRWATRGLATWLSVVSLWTFLLIECVGPQRGRQDIGRMCMNEEKEMKKRSMTGKRTGRGRKM